MKGWGWVSGSGSHDPNLTLTLALHRDAGLAAADAHPAAPPLYALVQVAEPPRAAQQKPGY